MKLIKTMCVVLASAVVGTSASAAETTQWEAGDDPIVIEGGTLVDVRTGRLVEDVVIVVDGDRIESVKQGRAESIPSGAVRLDATGKYIIPGLLDVHVHYKDWAAPLYLNHGVTTVTSLGDTYSWIKAQKEGIQAGLVPGPRLFRSTENLDYVENPGLGYLIKDFTRLVDSPDDATAAMREYIADGVDAVKVYDGLTVPQLRAIVKEADRANIPVIGHFSNVRVAAEVGAHGIEHTGAVAAALLDKDAKEAASKRIRKGLRIPDEAFMDRSRIPEIVELMLDHDLYLNPTIRMGWQSAAELRELGMHYEDFDLTYNDWRLRFMPINWVLANLKEYQEIGLWNWRDLTDYEISLFEQGYRNMQRLVKAFADAGGKLYAGTDSSNMAVPGLASHQELELMVAAGVSPLAALQSATINSAELMRKDDRLGTVEAGKAGDLVILDGNPLDDIRNTRRIWRVISRGEVLDGEYHADYRNPIPKNTMDGSSHYFPAPRILSASPEAVKQGARDAVVRVEGTGFIPYSFICWNGEKLATEFISRFELQASIPADLVENAGTYTITVENPEFAFGTTNASDLVHLGIQDYKSNESKLMVIP